MAACDTCQQYYHLHCLNPPLQRPPKKSSTAGHEVSADACWQCSECDKTSDSEPEVLEKKVPRRSRIRYSKDGAIISEPQSPGSVPNSPPPKKVDKGPKTEKSKVNGVGITENISPIKVTIKPFEFSSDGNETAEVKSKKDKKIKSSKHKEHTTASGGEEVLSKKLHKRSFTSPTLTNTPLMSITPIVADSPNDSHNENSNASLTNLSAKKEDGYFSQNLSFSALLSDSKERDAKAIESSIENTLANLSSDIATYKANRKRRKEKHRSRYSPDLMRSPSKSHKHKRKKKTQDMENPELPHPRITIKIKPIPKPDGSLDTQMFYVPTDSNDGPPPAVMKKLSKQAHVAQQPEQELPKSPPQPQPIEDTPVTPVQTVMEEKKETSTVPVSTKPKRSREGREGREGRARRASGGAPAAAPAPLTHCDVCTQPGDATNLVRCDECHKRYHFTCLEPPLNKNPKKRGYSWHCADCDPTDLEENN
ncbi:unnamed protein product [Parnassius apollo]|uniref:(apollo) hypothetical protein n=1 Tax=Parnassius apollo TaxID=110799 RepID=A0A8S3X0N1_PARAO|nr:unnamed protein product [Parnassius apollo]